MTDPIGNCILAGVNGAGKSTLYEALNELKGMPRINTDEIVKERVKIRINKGGHGISEEDIERRYVETFKNLKDVLKYLVPIESGSSILASTNSISVTNTFSSLLFSLDDEVLLL